MRGLVLGYHKTMALIPLHTLALLVAYKGAAFAGFARQPGLLTVQGELERALAMLLHRDVETTCAGRTDAGVHARGQVVSFSVTDEELAQLSDPEGYVDRDARPFEPEGTAAKVGDGSFARMRRSLDAITHDDIAVRSVWRAGEVFSARFDAKAREYRYFIATDITAPVFLRDFSWHVDRPLDVAAMERASRCLIGEHDFKSFCRAVSAEGKPTCRNLMEVSFSHECLFGENVLVIRVVGSSFLHSMVRTLVGSLVMVGKGDRDEEWLGQVLAACDRTAAGETAPAQGLVFWNVQY